MLGLAYRFMYIDSHHRFVDVASLFVSRMSLVVLIPLECWSLLGPGTPYWRQETVLQQERIVPSHGNHVSEYP